jgi:hypothetical protein
MRDGGDEGGDMKRFRRWLFNGTAAISLLLCVAMVVLWAVGGIHYFGRRPQFSVSTELGTLSLTKGNKIVFEVPVFPILFLTSILPVFWLRWRKIRR